GEARAVRAEDSHGQVGIVVRHANELLTALRAPDPAVSAAERRDSGAVGIEAHDPPRTTLGQRPPSVAEAEHGPAEARRRKRIHRRPAFARRYTPPGLVPARRRASRTASSP